MLGDQLVLSDLHLYSDKESITTNNDILPEFLNYLYRSGHKFEKIILLGDIFENWYINVGDAIKENSYLIVSFLNTLDDLLVNRNSEKIFVKGNHDSTSPLMHLDPVVYEYLKSYKYNIVERYEDRGAVYVHGHQGSISRTEWFFQMLGCKIWYHVCHFFKSPKLYDWGFGLVEKKASYRSADEKERKNYYHDLIKRVNPGTNAIIFGHTHVPIVDEELKIVNTGDWMADQTFVIRKEQEFILYSYVSYGNLVEVARLHL